MEYLIGAYVGIGLLIFCVTGWESEWKKGSFDILANLLKLVIVAMWPLFVIRYVRNTK